MEDACLSSVRIFHRSDKQFSRKRREGEAARGRTVFPRVVATSCILLVAGAARLPVSRPPSPANVGDVPGRRCTAESQLTPNAARYVAYPGAYPAHPMDTSPLGRGTARGTAEWPCPGRHVTHLITAFLINASVVRARLSENKSTAKDAWHDARRLDMLRSFFYF